MPGSPSWPHTALLPLPLSFPPSSCVFFDSPLSPAVETVKIEPHLPLPPPSLPPFLLQEISKREEASGQLSCIQLPVDSSGVRTAHPTATVLVSLVVPGHTPWCCSHRSSCHSFGVYLGILEVVFGFSFLFVTLIVKSALILSPFFL